MKSEIESRVVKTGCSLCSTCCGMNIYVEGGRAVRVSGMPEHPFSQGSLCARGSRVLDYVYSPDRLKYPMKKVNGSWQRISWDEALNIISGKLEWIKETFGARSLAVFFGMPQLGQGIAIQSMIRRLTDLYGTPNVFSVDSMCFRHRMVGHILTLGKYSIADPENARCVILWGHNPNNSCPPMARFVLKNLKAGEKKLIVVDPRRISMADRADLHVKPKPGSDCALALGMLNVIILEKLYDEQFVDEWTVGFDVLAHHLKQYSPEAVEEMTWVPAESIKQIARMFATSKPACIVQGTNSLDQHVSGVQTSRALAILHAITGNFDIQGGLTTSSALHLSPLRYLDKLEEKPLGIDDFPLFYEVLGRVFGEGQLMSLPDAILTGKPYPIKAMMISAANPLATWPNSQKVKMALQKLDFLVVFDMFMTPTAELADIVLPAASFMERTGIYDIYRLLAPVPYVLLGKKAIEPIEDCWSDLKFWLELGRRMGYAEYFPWKNEEEAIDYILKPSGLTIDFLTNEEPSGTWINPLKYKQYEQRGFQTPSGKVEIYSETLRDSGLDPLPVYRESFVGLSDEYPLILVTGSRMVEYTHSQLHNIDWLQKRVPEVQAEINPSTAKKYGIQNWEVMTIETGQGSLNVRAKVSEGIVAGVVNLPHGWAEANANILTDDSPSDPITGCPALKSTPCRICRYMEAPSV